MGRWVEDYLKLWWHSKKFIFPLNNFLSTLLSPSYLIHNRIQTLILSIQVFTNCTKFISNYYGLWMSINSQFLIKINEEVRRIWEIFLTSSKIEQVWCYITHTLSYHTFCGIHHKHNFEHTSLHNKRWWSKVKVQLQIFFL